MEMNCLAFDAFFRHAWNSHGSKSDLTERNIDLQIPTLASSTSWAPNSLWNSEQTF